MKVTFKNLSINGMTNFCIFEKLGIFKMADGFEDKTGYACCIISYMSKALKEPKIFIGKTNVLFCFLEEIDFFI